MLRVKFNKRLPLLFDLVDLDLGLEVGVTGSPLTRAVLDLLITIGGEAKGIERRIINDNYKSLLTPLMCLCNEGKVNYQRLG